MFRVFGRMLGFFRPKDATQRESERQALSTSDQLVKSLFTGWDGCPTCGMSIPPSWPGCPKCDDDEGDKEAK